MNCTATTRLTAEQCLERLAACPALPRGARMFDNPEPIPYERKHRVLWVGLLVRYGVDNVLHLPMEPPRAQTYWERKASPVRRLREERRNLRAELVRLREALADVIGPPCERVGRYCLTHQTNDCPADEARKLLGEP